MPVPDDHRATSETADDSRIVQLSVHHDDLVATLCFRVALVAFVVTSLAPLYMLVVYAVTPHLAVWDGPGLIPSQVSAEGLRVALARIDWPLAFFNSMVVSWSATLFALGVAIPTGYVFGRLSFPGRRPLFAGVVLLAVFPPQAFARPLLQLFRVQLRAFGLATPQLYNTHFAIALPVGTLTLPLSIALLTVFFSGIPDDLEAAARVEGATRLQALRRVILPLARPGVLSVATLVFVEAYTEYFFTAFMSQGYRSVGATIQTGIYHMYQPPWRLAYPNAVAAAGVIGLLPSALVLLYIAGRLDSWLSAWGKAAG
jgi:multiple sugar transport system permease protein